MPTSSDTLCFRKQIIFGWTQTRTVSAHFPTKKYLFASHFETLIANGVLRLPKESPALERLVEFTNSSYPELPQDFYFRERLNKAHFKRVMTEGPVHIGKMRWETWGPDALTYFLQNTGEEKHALARETLYPIKGREIKRVFFRPARAQISIPESSISIHFFGSAFRRILATRDGEFHPRSLFATLCREHCIVLPQTKGGA